MKIDECIEVSRQLLNDLRQVMPDEELVSLMEKLFDLRRLDEHEISYATDCLANRIYWQIAKKED